MLYNIIYVRMPIRVSDLRRFFRAVQFMMIHQSIRVALDTQSQPPPFLILGMAGSSPRRIFLDTVLGCCLVYSAISRHPISRRCISSGLRQCAQGGF